MWKFLNGYKPKVMVIDDIEENIRVLGTLLEFSGFEVEAAQSADNALEQLQALTPDIILLDVMMPQVDGFTLCKQLKINEKTKDIPVIFLTARTDEEAILQGFDSGGVDFISKPFNQKELLARIKTHLDLKITKETLSKKLDEITKINKQLVESKEDIERYYRLLQGEIISAADYVQSLLPPKIKKGKIATNWLFAPSQNLGGDSFGYHWIDDENFAIYLLDVSGHGVASALQSVSVLNMLRFETLPVKDFTNPAEVFRELNKAYPIQKHNYLFFTIFYAVFNTRTRILRYSGAGHPPPFLFTDETGPILLNSQNILIGTKDNPKFLFEELFVPQNAKLCIYSDGIIDPNTFDFTQWNEETLIQYIKNNILSSDNLDQVIDDLLEISITKSLKDDVSLLQINFL